MTVRGRFLVQDGSPDRLLVGFHGYAENAEIHLAELVKIAPGWTLAAVQAVHPFYSRERVVASWMTSQDRELAIEDNIAYVRTVVASFAQPRTMVFAGFSQGAAMAYRAAANIPCAGIIALGGDLPPDVTCNLPPVLIGRGTRDEWYSSEKLEKDLKFLASVTRVTKCVYDGAHEWTDEFRAVAADYLEQLAAL